ncbi:DUF397 domain-containing protein [Streptomyces sp. NPDC002643]
MSIAEPSDNSRLVWFTSSYSNGAGGECVECAITDDRALIRDSKKSEGPAITVARSPWRHFLRAVKCGPPPAHMG